MYSTFIMLAIFSRQYFFSVCTFFKQKILDVIAAQLPQNVTFLQLQSLLIVSAKDRYNYNSTII